MYCTECGAQINGETRFCTECGAPLKQKPDFEQQTAYRKETFEQGPGPAPDPEQPLPVSEPPLQREEPQPSAPATEDGASRPDAALQESTPSPAPKKSSKAGCIVGLIVAVVVILLLAGSCSMLSRCASSSSSGEGSLTTSSSNGAITSGYSAALPSNAAVASKDSWTILVYLCGSDLESEAGLATFNLQELASTSLGDKVTFAIETGGSRSWQNTTVDPRYLTRYVVNSGGFFEQQKLPSASMAASSTLKDFVTWGVEGYPADHYMLVLWDHGGGSVYGVCNDELYPYSSGLQADTLTLTEIATALDGLGITFDVIGFDTCLMATYETAAKLAPYADYLVASEEIEPGSGWDYMSWPQWLGAHTGATGAQLGAEICDTYYTKCKLYNAADMATLSVVDLSKVDAISNSFYDASREIAQAMDNRKTLRSLYRASLKATCFGGDASYNMVDLGDLMNKASGIVTEYYDDVIADVEKAVVYQVHGRTHSGVSGLSVFYPLDTSYTNEFYDYLDVAANVPYAQFAAVMFGEYNKVNWAEYASSAAPSKAPVVEEGISFEYDERVNDEGQLELEVTKGLEDIAEVTIELSLYLPDRQAVVFLGSDRNVNSDWEKGVFADNFYGEWMAIEGNWVSGTLYEVGEDYNLYYIPALLNGEETNIIARYDFNKGKYEVVCACAAFDEEGKLAAKEMRALEEGDVVEFQFSGYLIDEDEAVTFTIGQVVWSDSTTMADVDLGEGAYLFRFILTDVLGEDHETDLYVQNYEGDSVTVETLENYLAK